MPWGDADQAAAAASALARTHRLVDAEGVARVSLERWPGDQRLVFELGSALLKQGRAHEAVSVLRSALAVDSDQVNLQMLLAFTLNYSDGVGAAEVAREHLRYGMLLRRQLGSVNAVGMLRGTSTKRVAAAGRHRVLFVSADLRTHSVTYFLEPLLRHLPRDRFETVLVHVGRGEDDVTARLRLLADCWIDGSSLDHEALALLLRAEEASVAIDLSGLSSGHRMPVFARRIAPVQATYLGYPGGAGVDTIDARIADSITDPPESSNPLGERIVTLPRCFVCYQAPAEALAMDTHRAREAGRPVTFGCFGNLAKINSSVWRAWAGVLARTPGSCLILKNHGLADRDLHPRVLGDAKAAGIEPSRVSLLPPARAKSDHFATYQRIDIALDTFPYNGTTTTCEALVMGVPVVTLAGDRHSSRVGRSLLSAIEEEGLCAGDESEFGAIAAALAMNPDRLRTLHVGLRGRLLASPLCDGSALGAAFGRALNELITSPGRM